MEPLVRLLVVGAVLVLLSRAVRGAWRNRRLATAVWTRIRVRHVAGSLVLLVVVLGVALGLMRTVPITGVGFGTFIGLSGNAVFAPIEEAAMRTNGSPPADQAASGGALTSTQPPALLMVGITAFLVLLLLLFPWLAYVEERTFRQGLERAGPLRQVASALRFGLIHLIMLIPVAAALAIAVAGFVYGRVYRGAYRRAAQHREEVAVPLGGSVMVAPSQARVRTEAVLASTVWHTTFNSLIVLLVLVSFIWEWTRV